MNPDGKIIPIVEDDMGEGYQEPINEFMTEEELKEDMEQFAEKRRRKSIEKITRHWKPAFPGTNNPVLKHFTKHK